MSVGVSEDIYVTAPRKHFTELKAETQVDKAIAAPIKKGDTVGSLNISLGGEPILSKPLVAMNDIAEGGLFRRLYDALGQQELEELPQGRQPARCRSRRQTAIGHVAEEVP